MDFLTLDERQGHYEAHFAEGCREEEPEATAKVCYDMLAATQKLLHDHIKVSQLDGISHVMTLKAQFSLSQDFFDAKIGRAHV